MEDVLEKLHVAFVHCAVNNLRILFKSRFYCPGFCNAANEVYSRCWFCKTEGRKKRRFVIKCYEYDVIVQGDINDPSRKFVIKPRGISPEDAENFMATVLASCDDIITLEEAANMADTSREESPSTKKRKLNERLSHEFTRKKAGIVFTWRAESYHAHGYSRKEKRGTTYTGFFLKWKQEI
ncbi:hypothetical protein OSTOST_15272, partial [Ostertagia ostertagi]